MAGIFSERPDALPTPPSHVTSREGGGVPFAMQVQMRARLPLGLVALALAAAASASASAADVRATTDGRMSGATQITFGCPGPVRVGAPPCEHWSSFPHARFTLTRLRGGVPVSGSERRFNSDGRGRFTLPLAAGRYQLTPLAQAHSNGGAPITLSVRAGQTTWTLLRYQGYPRML
jgi:hypothetical protein